MTSNRTKLITAGIIIAILAISIFLVLELGLNGLNTFFIENFDGTSLDTAKWLVLENTDYSGAPAYGGSVKIADGHIDLSSDGPSFPFVCSLQDPFPTSGNFEFEFTVEYTCIADYASRVGISNAAPYEGGKWNGMDLIDVKADDIGNEATAIRINFFGTEVYKSTVQGFKPSAPEHIFKVNYINGTYTLYADGIFVAEKQSFERPNTIFLGSPPKPGVPISPENWEQWGYWGWSSFKVDYIRVVAR